MHNAMHLAKQKSCFRFNDLNFLVIFQSSVLDEYTNDIAFASCIQHGCMYYVYIYQLVIRSKYGEYCKRLS